MAFINPQSHVEHLFQGSYSEPESQIRWLKVEFPRPIMNRKTGRCCAEHFFFFYPLNARWYVLFFYVFFYSVFEEVIL